MYFCDNLSLWFFQHDPVPDNYDRIDPEHRQIYKFIKTLFHAAQLTAECAIITLVSNESKSDKSFAPVVQMQSVLIHQLGGFF